MRGKLIVNFIYVFQNCFPECSIDNDGQQLVGIYLSLDLSLPLVFCYANSDEEEYKFWLWSFMTEY